MVSCRVGAAEGARCRHRQERARQVRPARAGGRHLRRKEGLSAPRTDQDRIWPDRGTPRNRCLVTWRAARVLALTPDQAASPLASCPYDLRRAAVSLWLNAGAAAPDVAERAGHGVEVLLRVYAKCIDGGGRCSQPADRSCARRVVALLRPTRLIPRISRDRWRMLTWTGTRLHLAALAAEAPASASLQATSLSVEVERRAWCDPSGHRNGISQDIGMGGPSASADVEGASGDHRGGCGGPNPG